MSTTDQTPEAADRWASLRKRLHHNLRPWRQATPMARRLVIIGAVITAFFAVLAIASPVIAPYEADQYRFVEGTTDDPDLIDADCAEVECIQLPRRAEPSGEHLFGTTQSRFDVLSRIMAGARVALSVVIVSTLLSMLIGVPLGLYSGYRGGRIDKVLVMMMDAIYAFPPLILAIIVAFILQEYIEPGVPSAAAAVGVVYIPQYFRVIRNHTLSVKQEPFVEAARALGAKPRTIITRYVFFNVISSVPVIFTINAADAVLTLAGLGFLGFGVQFPAAEWGLDVSRAISDTVSGVWWTALFPGLAIMLLVTGLTLVGEGLNDIVNPLLRARGFVGKVRRKDRSPAESGGDA